MNVPTSVRAMLLALIAAGILTGCGAAKHEAATPEEVATKPAILPPASTPKSSDAAVAAEPALAIAPSPAARQAPASVANGALAKYAAESVAPMPPPYYPPSTEDNERYGKIDEHGVMLAAEQPFSTFSIDVDTGSYANIRRFLNQGRLPPKDAVRVEELVNYFPYRYAEPTRQIAGQRAPFGVTTEIAPSPWNPDSYLLRVGVKAFDQPRAALPPANLVFLVDVSGSMDSPDKLPLLKNALKLLTEQLRPQDQVSMVTYASGTQVVLPPTSGRDKATIKMAVDQLQPGGSTAGAAGIQLAYQMAQRGFVKDGINRILLATDGDFNVGVTDFAALKSMIEEKRRSGVSLSTLGFGDGNYNEQMMEQVADAGDGNYSYIDTLNEAQKVLVEEMSSTLSIVARDVKIQLEFNPGVVAEYRQIGFENRALKREDFRNDKVDAGEIGAGHSVTALYEITLVGGKGLLSPGKYATPAKPQGGSPDELATLRLRYKAAQGGAGQELEFPLARREIRTSAQTSDDFRFAAAVAAFGQQLRGGKYLGQFGYPQIEQLATTARGNDPFGYRGEFLRLVKLASALGTQPAEPAQPAGG